MNASAEAESASLAAQFGFDSSYIVQEFGYDDDVDMGIRTAIEAMCEELVGEEYNYVSDAALLWWRDDDGDVHDLTDLITDSMVTLEQGGPIWVLIPKMGREGHVEVGILEEAAEIAGMNTANTFDPGGDWLALLLTNRGRGR